jgi:hypothetical protein
MEQSVASAIASALKKLPATSAAVSTAPSESLLSSLRQALSSESTRTSHSVSRSKRERGDTVGTGAAAHAVVSDDDDGDGDGGDDDDKPGYHGTVGNDDVPVLKPTKGVVADVLANVEKFGSLVNWIRLSKMRSARNRRECEALADIADSLLEEGIAHDSPALEKLLRRLSGVHLADALNNWAVCDSLQYTGPGDTLLSRRVLTETLQQAAQMESLMRKVTHQGYTQRSTRDSFSGRGRGSFGRGGSRGRGSWSGRSSSFGSSSSSSGTSSSQSGSASQQ